MRVFIFSLDVEGDEGTTYQKITVPRETRLELRLTDTIIYKCFPFTTCCYVLWQRSGALVQTSHSIIIFFFIISFWFFIFCLSIFLIETSSGLKNREMVDFILNRSIDALRDYVSCSYPDKPSRFAHILLRLPSLRNVCSKMADECLFARSFLSMAVPQALSLIMEMKM